VLLSLEKLRVPNLIIIDALDECGERNVQRSLLSTLHDITSNSSVGIRFLICSRPENDICSTFSNVKMRYSHTRLILNERYYPDEDIELFLRDRLNDIIEGHIFRNKIPPSWPTDYMIQYIVDRSSGQFIYAATVIRYVESSRHLPHQRLEVVMGLRRPFKDSPFAQLDELYRQVLMNVAHTSMTLDILAFLVIYEEGSISLYEAAIILGIQADDVMITLSDIESLVSVSQDTNDGLSASLLHKSLQDFLLDQHRSQDLFIDRISTVSKHCIDLIRIFIGKYTLYDVLASD